MTPRKAVLICGIAQLVTTILTAGGLIAVGWVMATLVLLVASLVWLEVTSRRGRKGS